MPHVSCTNTLRKVMTQHFCIPLFILNTSGVHKESVDDQRLNQRCLVCLGGMPHFSNESHIVITSIFKMSRPSLLATAMRICQ